MTIMLQSRRERTVLALIVLGLAAASAPAQDVAASQPAETPAGTQDRMEPLPPELEGVGIDEHAGPNCRSTWSSSRTMASTSACATTSMVSTPSFSR